MRKKDVVGIETFDLIGLLPTNHIIAYKYNGILEFVRKRSMLTVKQLKKHKIFEISLSNLQEMANFGDYPGDIRFY